MNDKRQIENKENDGMTNAFATFGIKTEKEKKLTKKERKGEKRREKTAFSYSTQVTTRFLKVR